MVLVLKKRKCWGCAEEKPRSAFPKHKDLRGLFWHSRYCAECEEWYTEHQMQIPVRKPMKDSVSENFNFNAY